MKKSLLLIIISLYFSKNCFGQNQNIIEPNLSKTDLHQVNIGKIFFTQQRIPYENLNEDNFLKTYKLTNKSDIFFVAYFDNSLTNYKHQLIPKVSLDSLFKMGNYQFSLFVDNKLIYQSNLIPGAPQIKNQNMDTYLNRPFIDNINGQGTWSESFWNRFMNNGGDTILTDGKHLLKMEIRPYVKTDKIITGEIIATGDLLLEVDRNPIIDITKIKLNKVKPYDGLKTSKSYFDKSKIKQLKGAIDEGIYKKINSIIVLKEGKILIEEYFNGENRNTLYRTRKS